MHEIQLRGEVLPGGNLEGPLGAQPWARDQELPRRQKEWSGEVERGCLRVGRVLRRVWTSKCEMLCREEASRSP